MTKDSLNRKLRIFSKKEISCNKVWLSEAWLGDNGKVFCSLYSAPIGKGEFEAVRQEDLVFVPAKILKMNVKNMERVK